MVRGFLRFHKNLSVAALAVVALVAGACSDPQSAKNSSSPRAHNTEINRSLDDEVRSFMARYPTVVKGKFGTSDTSAYLKILRPRLTDRPYGAEDGVVLSASGEFGGAPPPVEMPALSRAIVSGRVVAIGLPHFNSSDGSFWAPEFDPEVPDVAKTILRDVLFQVDEVWGSLLPDIVPGSLVPFGIRGGQIAVDLPDDVAERLWHQPGGTYIFSEESPVDLGVGESAVLFLDVRPLFGLYNGRLAARFELFPASELGFKYIHKDPNTIGLRTGAVFDISVSRIQSIIQQQLGERADYPGAELGAVYPLGPHRPGMGNRAPIIGVSP